VNRSKDRNWTLFHVNFLLDALRKLITRRQPDETTGITKERRPLIPGDNPLKPARFCSISAVRKSFEYDTLSFFWQIDRVRSTQRRLNFSS
jgi:hypothetical protein